MTDLENDLANVFKLAVADTSQSTTNWLCRDLGVAAQVLLTSACALAAKPSKGPDGDQSIGLSVLVFLRAYVDQRAADFVRTGGL